ncbi:MAG TPA: hypothetical protein VGC42_28205, partial [Kofleriaceae bacterium]
MANTKRTAKRGPKRGPKRGTKRGRRRPAASEVTGASRLAKALQALAEGLPNPADESTYYFKGFHAPLARAIELTPSSVKQA